jgi:pilus assembly protein CpaB
MNRRVLTILGAVLLTLFGTVLLVAYVNSAERRALAGEELTTVLVTTEEIAANVAAAELGDRVAREEVPRNLRPEDAVTTLDELGNRVTAVNILPGETLRTGRFQSPDQAQTADGVEIPEGTQIVTLSLEPQRALGGRVRAGQLVGVMLSVDQAEIPNPADPAEAIVVDTATGMVLNQILVTNVSGGIDEETGQVENAVMVSFAVDESDAERLVFGAEHGRVWLTEQNEETPTLGGQFRTRRNIFEAVDEGGP